MVILVWYEHIVSCVSSVFSEALGVLFLINLGFFSANRAYVFALTFPFSGVLFFTHNTMPLCVYIIPCIISIYRALQSPEVLVEQFDLKRWWH